MRRLFFLFIIGLTLTGCQIISTQPVASTLTPVLLAAAPPTATGVPVSLPPAGEATETPIPAAARPAPPTVTTIPLPAPTPARLVALGQRSTVVLRAEPRTDATAVAQVPGAQILWAEGRSADSAWLWVAYGDDSRAWGAARDLKLFGDATDLPVVTQAVELPAAAPVATRPAAPAPAPRLAGKLVFQVATGGDIYLVNADGTGLRRLTDGIDPALSPDGTQVAFARWGAPHGIFLLDLRTGQERRVISANRPRSPAWSPDGRQIAFAHLVDTDVCLASPFGCLDEATLRARFGGQDCLVTPFGRTCIQDYEQRTTERLGLARVNTDGQGWLDIPAATDAQAVAWQPGSDTLLYRGANSLQTTGPGRAPQTLVRDAAAGSPAWSPDGARFAAQVRLHDRTDIFLFDASGRRVAQLTSTATGGIHNVAPAWSPDGKSLLFLSNRDGTWRLYRMSADGSGQAPFLPAALKDIRFSYDFAAERVVSWGN